MTKRERRERRNRMMAWFEAMGECWEQMTPAELAEVEAWQDENVTGDGRCGTSDWPGWASRIGPKPGREDTRYERLAARLHVAPDMLDLIADGEVDAFLVADRAGRQVALGGSHGAPMTASRWRDARPALPPRRRSERGERKERAGPFVLYRLYGANDRLLYVGITRNLTNRMRAHQRKWREVIERFTTEEYDDLSSLMEAERAAIRDERPALNIDGIDEL